MRVLYLTMNPNRASTTVPTEGWFRLLPARGLEPVLVTRTEGAFSTWAREAGVPVYQDDLPFPDKRRPAPFFHSLWTLRRLIARHRIELVHCNEQDVYPIGQYAARLAGIPVVVSVHFTLERGFCSWAFGGRRQPSRIFFVSRGNLDACRPAVDGVIDESRWRVMYNGLDLDRYRPDGSLRQDFRNRHGVNGDVLVGVACALRPRKQLEHLIEAAARVGSQRVRIAIAGGPVPGDEAYAAALLQQARDRLGDRLLLLGHLDDLRAFYNGLDIFVNTSQEEACSISVMESLACGCPVLGYPSKSVDDQILPDGGEIVGQDDVASLTDRLRDWVEDSRGLSGRREPARGRSETMFDIRTLADQLWSEYVALAPRTAPPRLTDGQVRVE
jgi:glycosyltransferase involved in cell wall biosynthesis